MKKLINISILLLTIFTIALTSDITYASDTYSIILNLGCIDNNNDNNTIKLKFTSLNGSIVSATSNKEGQLNVVLPNGKYIIDVDENTSKSIYSINGKVTNIIEVTDNAPVKIEITGTISTSSSEQTRSEYNNLGNTSVSSIEQTKDEYEHIPDEKYGVTTVANTTDNKNKNSTYDSTIISNNVTVNDATTNSYYLVDDKNNTLEEVVFDKNNYWTSKLLVPGIYYLKDKFGNIIKKYNLNDSNSINNTTDTNTNNNSNNNNTATNTTENVKVGNVEVENTEHYTLFDSKGNKIEDLSFDNNGNWTIDNLPYGIYYIKNSKGNIVRSFNVDKETSTIPNTPEKSERTDTSTTGDNIAIFSIFSLIISLTLLLRNKKFINRK